MHGRREMLLEVADVGVGTAEAVFEHLASLGCSEASLAEVVRAVFVTRIINLRILEPCVRPHLHLSKASQFPPKGKVRG